MGRNSKHTPGPWERNGNHIYALQDDKKPSLNRMYVHLHPCTYEGYASLEEQEANARLIAAAPDMLEALETCKNLLDDLEKQPVCYHNPELQMFANAIVGPAIAKAKGEAP